MKIAIFAYSHGGCAAARRVRAVLAEAETVCYAVPRLKEAGFLPLDEGSSAASAFRRWMR